MNTGLGLSFWRIVNEEGSNGWAQIYARIPFDDAELKSKGALFGVVFGEDKEDWAEKDTELMTWVEEYFNKLETVGDLVDFGEKWRSRYPELTGVWVWINAEGKRRELRVAKWGEAAIILTRNQKEFDFSKNLLEGKVVKGLIEEGDKLSILTGKIRKEIAEALPKSLEEDIAKWNKELINSSDAAAGLIFNFGKLSEETEEEYATFEKNEKVTVEEPMIPESFEKEKEPVIEERRRPGDLAQDRLVGPIGMKEKVVNWWMRFRPIEQRGVVARPENTKRKKWSMLLGILFLILLLVSIVTGSIKMKRTAELKKWQSFSEPIEKSLQEAGSLVSINPTGAKKLIEDVRVEFDTGKAQFVNSKFKNELADLEKKINDTWTVASGEKESQIGELLRIDLVRQGFKGDRLNLLKDNQFLSLDSAMGVIVSAEARTKDIKVVAGKGEGLGWIDVVSDGKIMVLNSAGVRSAVDGADLIKFDAAVAKPVALGKFGSNLYVLDQGNKEIYKYAAISEGFGDRTRWLKQDQTISGEPVDMAIDSDIWVVSERGQVERFRRGSKEQFTLNGLPAVLKVRRIAVDQNNPKIALLDSTNAVVIVCDKENGSCGQTLKSGKLLEATDIEFDSQGNLLVLINGVVGVMK